MRYRFLSPLSRLLFGNSLYGLTLRGKRPDGLRIQPLDPWSGDSGVAGAILDGEFHLAGRWWRLGRDPWNGLLEDDQAMADLHSFGWLADLGALGSTAAQERARQLTTGWMDTNQRWDFLVWRPDVLGRRLTALLTEFPFLVGGARNGAFTDALLSSVSAQARHLRRVAMSAEFGRNAFSVAKGLIYCGLALPDKQKMFIAGKRLLETEINRQILPDGGHVQRNPAAHLFVLKDLSDIRTLLLTAKVEVPASLLGAIDHMTPILRTFRLGDGSLTSANGGNEQDPGRVASILSQAGVRGKTLLSAPHSGFQRLAASGTTVLVDTGAPSPPEAGGDAHAGALSFEMSVGKHRMVVNCGSFEGSDDQWRTVARGTAAHSTVVVEDMNSSEILKTYGIRRRVANVIAARSKSDGNTRLEAQHDGYLKPLGLVHHRQLILEQSGHRLRGEDSLTGGAGLSFVIRFHLHPDVRASLASEGQTVLLQPGGNEGWRFGASRGRIILEESVYMASPGTALRRSRQITVSDRVGKGGTTIHWQLERIDR